VEQIPLLSAAPIIAGRMGGAVTPRLELRPIDEGLTEALAAVFAKPEVWMFPFGRGLTRSETEEFVAAQAGHWRTLGFGLWALVDRSSASTIGYAGLSVPTFLPEVLPAVEVGWRLEPESWGRGYATEAATAALEQAFTTLGLAEVISLPQVANPPSVRVAERLGMQLRRTVTAPAAAKRGPVQVALMSMTCSEWEPRQRSWDRRRG
jgi:RimJ/RimL family protein N-acetyltransferase